MMRHLRNAKFNGERRKKLIDKIDASERNEEKCSDLCHKVRRIEEVKNLQNSQTYQDVNREKSEDIDTANLQDTSSCLLKREQECDSEKQDAKRARVDAINQS